MPIQYFHEQNCFKLDTPTSSYVIGVEREKYLVCLHYGGRIPDVNIHDSWHRNGFSSFNPNNPNHPHGSFSPDIIPLEYAGFGTGDFRKSAVAIKNADGNDATDFRYVDYTITPGKPKLDGLPATYANTDDECNTLTIRMRDNTTGAEAYLSYTVFETVGAMTRSVRIVNTSDRPMDIEKVYSASVSLPDMDYDMLHLYGRWGAERNMERRPLAHGHSSISSTRGSSSHNHNPFVALLKQDAGEDWGEVYGFNLVYSGNFDITADCDFYATTRVNIGINPDGFTWHLDPGGTFQTPEAVLVYTDEGLGEMSRIYHRLYRENLIRGKWKHAKRPLLINSWEAAFFDFDTDKLVSFAERAKEVGIEMLVMDDGWFGVRNLDNCSLGDWYVNETKLPGGLSTLIERVNALGLKFGIWYEPEMISPDSDLYRAHPDWCLHVPNRDKSIARLQYVLDMSREDVRDNIFAQMASVLANHKIDYVKWDFNRNLTEAGSALLTAEHGEEIFHRFVLGTYALMERLVNAFPDLLIENCSGGGGRFDAGMLYYSPQIWASDNTDAIERIAIQFGTTMCYPASSMGAHVSMSHRTGFETKGNVAMWGTFGYELDPNHLNERDRAIVKEQIQAYHKTYELTHEGDLYRIIAPWENEYYTAWELVSPDKTKMLFTFVTMRYCHIKKNRIRFKGLDEGKMYCLASTGEVYSGALLMKAGIAINDYPQGTGESFTLYFEEV